MWNFDWILKTDVHTVLTFLVGLYIGHSICWYAHVFKYGDLMGKRDKENKLK